MNIFYQAEWRQKVFMRDEIRDFGLYVVTGGIIFAGFLNLIFLFINLESELYDQDTSQEESPANNEIYDVDV